ncbi:hypothetical protein THRCLA_22873 [Thraustotheca clavata]|uniref:Alcohol dehydrogenase-like C-terminal domain-containing protein n=1 Tax=Thraustotheca clavata TaxID=74557 RepID=A0A1V9YRW3_9STRA|nr:hypothetical protein THRCLA_22873 [Thraustotheca clavata]
MLVSVHNALEYGSTAKDEYVTQGGYADYYRCHVKFVIPIPNPPYIQWAVALGTEVTALSSPNRKEKECKELLGAHHLVNYSDPEAVEGAGAVQSCQYELELLAFSCGYGRFFCCSSLFGSIIGVPSTIEEMLVFAVEKNVNLIVQLMRSQAADALKKVQAGQARFRIVLEN